MTSPTATKERPILFSAEMVRALLSGDKTQTRRAVNPQPPKNAADNVTYPWMDWRAMWPVIGDEDKRQHTVKCPYGAPGDRLWVKERVGESIATSGNIVLVYEADGLCQEILSENHGEGDECALGETVQREPTFPIHWRNTRLFPRWASRLTLEIDSIRVERLQDISEADAIAEGIRTFTKDGTVNKYWPCDPIDDHPPNSLYTTWQDMPRDPREAFKALWDSINAKSHPWSSNPWVFVVAFHPIEVPT